MLQNFVVCILYLIYCNYYHIYPMTFFLHISPSLFFHGTAFISYNLRAHLYHPTVFFSLPSANMVLLSFSWLSPFLACHTLHTPHLTQFCIVIAYLPCLLAAPFLHSCSTLISCIWFTPPPPPFIACFSLATYACFLLNTCLCPYIFLIFCMLFCHSLPNSATIHMAPLCERLIAQDNFCTSA